MKTFKKILLILFLFLCLLYSCNLSAIPNNVVLFEGEDLNIPTLLGINILKTEDVSTIPAEETDNVGVGIASNRHETKNKTNTQNYSVSIANVRLKDITVNVIPKTQVVISGNTIGAKLYTNGVLVVGMSEINGTKPYENSGIEEGDMIVEIDKQAITCTVDLVNKVNKSKGQNLNIKYLREGEEHFANINPVKTNENEYKLGLWVRDAAAGVGTMTFYEPETKSFAALGHGIMDIDTNQLINISNGELVTSKIISIVKGKSGKPGEIKGTIENGLSIGSISKNTPFGIFGNINNINLLNLDTTKTLEVANRDEIKKGPATILVTLEDGKTEEYAINIEKIYYNNNSNNKSMLIKVTDEKLIEKTGGIIQGMSGSPIIQNGKFIGAVTHVLVNDATEGYAVFGDLMVKNLKTD